MRVLRGALLCDGTAPPARGSIVVDGGRIAAVVDAAAPPPPDAEIVDAAHLLITPGLIDAHTHLFLSGDLERPMAYERELIRDALPLRALRGAYHGRLALGHGVTTVRDVCTEGAGYADVALRDAIAAGWCEGPRVVPCGPGIGITGGYMPSGVAPGVCVPSGCAIVDGADAARREVRTQVTHGAAWIKVFADWACSDPAGGAPSVRPTFTGAELEAIVDEAARRGRRVAAHATSDAGARHAIACGVASLEHIGPHARETFDLAAARGVAVVPTLAALDYLAETAAEGPRRDELRRRRDAAAEGFATARAAGARIVCGTDIGCYPHARGARGELRMYMQLGMSGLEALRTATVDAAALLGLDDIGRLAAGRAADLCGFAIVGGPDDDRLDLPATLAAAPALVLRAGNVVARA